MNCTIDCLLIGHNEMNFNEYADAVYSLGKDSAAYRDLALNFIWHAGKRHTVMDILNEVSDRKKVLTMGDICSTTLAYLGTYLDKHGYSFDFINDFQKEKELLKNKIESGNVLSIAITTTLYTHVTPIMEICHFIRRIDQHIKIIIGGPFVLNLFFASQDVISLKNLLRTTHADILVTNSQGEATLLSILERLKNGNSFDAIPNITYWKKGVPECNHFEQEDNSLDKNIINWPLFSDHVNKFVSVRTCLSCPFNCRFCGFNQRAGRHRTAEVKTIEKELDLLESLNTVKSINFIDDTFNFPQDRFKEILKMMIRKQYSFKWNSYFRCQFADEETIELMEESGCEGVYLGIESANQTVLDNMRKGVKVDNYKKGISLLKKSSIIIHTNFMFGFIGETDETVKDTINFINEYEPDFYRIQLWYLDRITPIWKERDKFNLKGSYFMWSHGTMNSSEACDLIEKAVVENKSSSVWLPVHNFNFHNLFRLIHSGMDVELVKGFLTGFSEGIKENILSDKMQISENVISLLKENSI